MQPVIVSASRRTDIPAFYAEWFMNRVRVGSCTYPNPFVPKQVYRVDLRPAVVTGFVFWTRHAQPLICRLRDLDRLGYAYYFLYTVVGYPRDVDPRAPSADVAVATFVDLARRIGRHRVIWRYDPIVLNAQSLSDQWHRQNFARLLDRLRESTDKVIVSVVDPYAKTRRRLGDEGAGVQYGAERYAELLTGLAQMAFAAGLRVQSCAEPALSVPGIEPGPCVDAALMATVSGTSVPATPHRQRAGCLCHRSVDIGVANTCGFGCKYCYATVDHLRARERQRRHDSNWTSIIGDLTPDGDPAPSSGTPRCCRP